MKVIPPQTHMNPRHVIVNGINGIQGSGWAEASMHGSLLRSTSTKAISTYFFKYGKAMSRPGFDPRLAGCVNISIVLSADCRLAWQSAPWDAECK